MAEDHEISNVEYFHIGDEYKYLITRISEYALMDRDLDLTNFDNFENFDIWKKKYWCR